MTSLRKIERDRTIAELASIESLLAGLADEDVMTKMSLEDRRDELRRIIEEFLEFEEGTASAALFFGGAPVAGQLGVESEFAGNAVTRFQDLVSKLLVDEIGQLGQRGPVPNKAASTMHITNIVRGSFGFLMQEIESQGELVDTALTKAVDQATELLTAFGDRDEGTFQNVAESVDGRILATAGDFFKLLNESGATFRLVASGRDAVFGMSAVQLGAQRAETTTTTESEEQLAGQLHGVLPESHMVEFRNAIGDVLRGRVDRSISSEQLMQWNLTLLNQPANGRFRIRRVFKDGEVVREAYTLLELNANNQEHQQIEQH